MNGSMWYGAILIAVALTGFATGVLPQMLLLVPIFLSIWYLQIRLVEFYFSRGKYFLFWEHGAERLRVRISNHFFDRGWESGFFSFLGETASYVVSGSVLVAQILIAIITGALQIYFSLAVTVLVSNVMFGTSLCIFLISCK